MNYFYRILKNFLITGRSISAKLFFLLIVLLAIAFTIILYLNINTFMSHDKESVISNAIHISNIIKRATRYSMLKNSRDDLTSTIMSIGKEQDIDGVRIYNKKGKVSFSNNSKELNQIVDKQAEQCYVCHARGSTKTILPTKDRTRTLKSKEGYRQLGLINPIENEPDCFTADCHAHSPDVKLLGLLDVKLSLQKVDAKITATKRKIITYSLILILITAVLVGSFIWKMIHYPIKKLAKGTKEVAKLNFDYKVDVKSQDELGDLASSFNKMTTKLKESTDELKKTQSSLILSEKMASLGKLSGMVAHEINNPLSGILSYAKLSLRYLNEESNSQEAIAMTKQNLSLIADEAKRCGDIVRNLLLFSKSKLGVLKSEHLNKIITNSVKIIKHSAKMKGITILKELDHENDLIKCYPSLQQVLIALIMNSIEATPSGGKVTIKSYCNEKNGQVKFTVSDNGKGIPKDIISNIFEPYFTTKETEKSTGVGLSVVYGIVKQHGGNIEVESKVNRGTKFTVTLPRVPPNKDDN